MKQLCGGLPFAHVCSYILYKHFFAVRQRLPSQFASNRLQNPRLVQSSPGSLEETLSATTAAAAVARNFGEQHQDQTHSGSKISCWMIAIASSELVLVRSVENGLT